MPFHNTYAHIYMQVMFTPHIQVSHYICLLSGRVHYPDSVSGRVHYPDPVSGRGHYQNPVSGRGHYQDPQCQDVATTKIPSVRT